LGRRRASPRVFLAFHNPRADAALDGVTAGITPRTLPVIEVDEAAHRAMEVFHGGNPRGGYVPGKIDGPPDRLLPSRGASGKMISRDVAGHRPQWYGIMTA
jgi:hypothetical protein